MPSELLVKLALLAVADSTSAGTLVVPALLAASARFRLRPMLVYIATLVTFYFAVGMALLLGASVVAESLGETLNNRSAQWVQLVLGLSVVAWCIFGFNKKPDLDRGISGRARKLLQTEISVKAAAVFALGAGVVEVATMLPYLVAIRMMAEVHPPPLAAVLLAGYCGVMILPALGIAVFRSLLGQHGDRLFSRTSEKLALAIQQGTPWILGLIGMAVAANAYDSLFR